MSIYSCVAQDRSLYPQSFSTNMISCGFVNVCKSAFYLSKAFIRKDMLETYFPGVDVILSIQPPNLQRRVLVRIIRLGGFTIIAFGEHVLQRMGIPRHVFIGMLIGNPSLWSLGKAIVTVLEETEAFEVYFNGELIFSKLKEDRFPTEFELRELVARKIVDSTVEDGLGAGILWS
ncbi:hypothetical protein ACHQM5_013638 [Ranunculus cassubicifolius]